MTEMQKQQEFLELLNIKLPPNSQFFAAINYEFQSGESAKEKFDRDALPLILEQADTLKIKGAVDWFIHESLQNIKDFGRNVSDSVTVDVLSKLSIERPRITVRNSPAQYFDATKYINRNLEDMLEQLSDNNTHIALDVIVKQANYIKLVWNTSEGELRLYLRYNIEEDKIIASSDKQGKKPYIVQLLPGTPVNSFSITSYFKLYSDEM